MTAKQGYPRARLDALTDGVFGVAMTLLVLDVRFPDVVQAMTEHEIATTLVNMLPKLLPYFISFFALGFHWLGLIKVRTHHEYVGRHYATWTLVDLFFVTFLPLSSTVVGRYSDEPAAIWLYSANIAVLALLALVTIAGSSDVQRDHHARERIAAAVLLLASAALAALASFFAARHALWAYALNAFAPVAFRAKGQDES